MTPRDAPQSTPPSYDEISTRLPLAATGASALIWSARKASALDYPTRTVRFVVG